MERPVHQLCKHLGRRRVECRPYGARLIGGEADGGAGQLALRELGAFWQNPSVEPESLVWNCRDGDGFRPILPGRCRNGGGSLALADADCAVALRHNRDRHQQIAVIVERIACAERELAVKVACQERGAHGVVEADDAVGIEPGRHKVAAEVSVRIAQLEGVESPGAVVAKAGFHVGCVRREEAEFGGGSVFVRVHLYARRSRAGSYVRHHARARGIVGRDGVLLRGDERGGGGDLVGVAVEAHFVRNHECGELPGASGARAPQVLVAAHGGELERQLRLVSAGGQESRSHPALSTRLDERQLRVALWQTIGHSHRYRHHGGKSRLEFHIHRSSPIGGATRSRTPPRL